MNTLQSASVARGWNQNGFSAAWIDDVIQVVSLLDSKVNQQHRRTLFWENFSLKALCDSIQYATEHAWMAQNGFACRRVSFEFSRKNEIKKKVGCGSPRAKNLLFFDRKNQSENVVHRAKTFRTNLHRMFPREHFLFKSLAENCLFILCWQINVTDDFSFYSFFETLDSHFFTGKVQYWKSCVCQRRLNSEHELWVDEL